MRKMKSKVCTTCKIEKPIEEFLNDKSSKSGKSCLCKVCKKISDRKCYEKRRVLQKEMGKDYVPPKIASWERLKNFGVKVCVTCGIEKSIDEFTKRSGKRLPVYSQCKLCDNKRKQIYCAKPENKIRTRLKNSLYSSRLNRWKRGAISRGLEWSITDEYLNSLPWICHYTGLDLITEANKFNTISLDRIDSSKGYIEGNVVFCCWMINCMKNEYSVEKFVEMCKFVVDKHYEKSNT